MTSLFASIRRSSHQEGDAVSRLPRTVVLVLAAGDLNMFTDAESSTDLSMPNLGHAAEISHIIAPFGLLLGDEERQNLFFDGCDAVAPVSNVAQSDNTLEPGHFRCFLSFQLEGGLANIGSAPSFVTISPLIGLDDDEICRRLWEGKSCVVRYVRFHSKVQM